MFSPVHEEVGAAWSSGFAVLTTQGRDVPATFALLRIVKLTGDNRSALQARRPQARDFRGRGRDPAAGQGPS
jgi:hypothetical protein